MLVPIGLFLTSWFLSYLGATALSISSLRSPIGISPYGAGGQRQYTILELWALQRIYRQSEMLKQYTVKTLFNLQPLWAKMVGILADLLFLAALIVIPFSFSIQELSPLRLGFLIYCGVGTVIFAYHVLVLGEIGRIGYHLRFVVSIIFWPVLLIFVELERRGQ